MTVVFIPREGSEYTDHPSGLKVEYRDASHRYWLHTDRERIAVPSVTGVLKVLDKPALIPWAEARGIEGALAAVRTGSMGLDDPNPVSVVRSLKLGADAARDAGADRGTSLHDALEVYVRTGKVPSFADFPEEHRGYVQALCRWLLAAQPEPLQVEVCVGSVEHGFAGRLDLVATIGGRELVVDLKSSAKARVYPEAHLQCAAYQGALVECGHREPEGGLIVAIGADGDYAAAECVAAYDDFLSVLEASKTMGRLRSLTKEAA